MADVLRLRAKPGLLYPHLQREAAGTRAFVGHRHGVALPGPAADGSQDVYGFVPSDEVLEIEITPETYAFAQAYAVACADGDLVPVDQETAALCRKFTGRVVAFSPTPEAPKPSAPKAAAQKG